MGDADLTLEALLPKAKILGLVPLSMDTERAEKLRAEGVDPDTAERIYPSWVSEAHISDCEKVVGWLEHIQKLNESGVPAYDDGYIATLTKLKTGLAKIRVGTAGKTNMFPIAKYQNPV